MVLLEPVSQFIVTKRRQLKYHETIFRAIKTRPGINPGIRHNTSDCTMHVTKLLMGPSTTEEVLLFKLTWVHN